MSKGREKNLMKVADRLKNRQFLYFVLMTIPFIAYQLFIIANIIYHCFILKEHFFLDFWLRWQETAYMLIGSNPMDVDKGLLPIDPRIGNFPFFPGNCPWGYTMGIFWVLGFLPLPVAKILSLIMYIAILVVTAFLAYRYFKNKGEQNRFILLSAALIIFVETNWAVAIRWGNLGAFCACFLIIAVLLLDKHPVVSGVLFGLAMYKPQVAALFFISLLLQRRFKAFFTACSLICITWAASAVFTGVSPIDLLLQANANGTGISNGTFGIFDLFSETNILTIPQSIYASAIFGIVFTTVISIWLSKKPHLKDGNLLYYSIPAVASTLWFYKQPHDFIIIAILALATLEILSKKDISFKKFIILMLLMLTLYCFNVQIASVAASATVRVFGFIFNNPDIRAYHFNVLYLYRYAAWIVWFLIIFDVSANKKFYNFLKIKSSRLIRVKTKS
ncbi:MAG: DUF2029 domain-containing protein [Oscillospiraceae bacterium]|jgi:hypothetical protein|nr:DUF2029 domain-containing protein [Oscillospiraceae bacterium]